MRSPFHFLDRVKRANRPHFEKQRRLGLQHLERRDLLAGDGDFVLSQGAEVPEGGANAIVYARTERSAGETITFKLDNVSGQASFSEDSLLETIEVFFAAGTSVAVFRVYGVVDDIADGDQTVNLSASGVGGIVVASVELTVIDSDNSPPEIVSLSGLGLENAVLPGGTVTLTGLFSDANQADEHLVTVDWGDGTIDSFPADAGVEFNADHVYVGTGLYDVQVTVSDGLASDTESILGAVTGVSLSEKGTIDVVGTPGHDRVLVSKFSRKIVVLAKLDGIGWQGEWFKESDVSALNVWVGDGNDFVGVAKRVKLPAFIDAGSGSDIVLAGNGNTTVLGGLGDDILVTRDGDDVLLGGPGLDVLSAGRGADSLDGGEDADIYIGGHGADELIDSEGDDIMIGGATSFEHNVIAMKRLIRVWSSDQTFEERVNAMGSGSQVKGIPLKASRTVSDDGAVDTFTSSDYGDRDWFFADQTEITGALSDDLVSTL